MDLGSFILQSVSKKTTHRSVKKISFYLWFFPPPFAKKYRFFGVFHSIWASAIIKPPRGTATKSSVDLIGLEKAVTILCLKKLKIVALQLNNR